MRAILLELLGAAGFEVLEAANGLEALLQVKRTRPDGVILDIQMPRLGGLDALRRIRAFDPRIRVVILTGLPDPELRNEARAGGAAAFLEKPIVLDDILAALDPDAPPPASRSRRAEPVVEAAPAAPPAAAEIVPAAPAAPEALASVLVVDDDPEVRSLLLEALQLRGYEVRGAPDGTDALREITRRPPDVILLDIEMPGLNGVDALPAIRALAPDAAVIMVSGSSDADVSRQALARGAFDYVTKPIDFDYLTQSVETAVTMRSLER